MTMGFGVPANLASIHTAFSHPCNHMYTFHIHFFAVKSYLIIIIIFIM